MALCSEKEEAMHKLVSVGFLALLSSSAHSQEITTSNTVRVLADGHSGGQNAAIWKADCQPGMVLTGIELAVGGSATTNVIGTAGPWRHSSFIALRFKRENKSGPGGGGSALDRLWFTHPFAHRLDHCDDACAAERAKDRPDLHMRPCPSPHRRTFRSLS